MPRLLCSLRHHEEFSCDRSAFGFTANGQSSRKKKLEILTTYVAHKTKKKNRNTPKRDGRDTNVSVLIHRVTPTDELLSDAPTAGLAGYPGRNLFHLLSTNNPSPFHLTTAMYQGDQRTRTMGVYVDDVMVTSWTSSGTTTGFEKVDIGVAGQTVELRGVLESSEWLSIMEVNRRHSIADCCSTNLQHASYQKYSCLLLAQLPPSWGQQKIEILQPSVIFAVPWWVARCTQHTPLSQRPTVRGRHFLVELCLSQLPETTS